MFRPRLYSIPDEKALWEYFEKNARYLPSEQVYSCAGVCSDDTARLFQKLKEEWKKDIEERKQEDVEESLRLLNGEDGSEFLREFLNSERRKKDQEIRDHQFDED